MAGWPRGPRAEHLRRRRFPDGRKGAATLSGTEFLLTDLRHL